MDSFFDMADLTFFPVGVEDPPLDVVGGVDTQLDVGGEQGEGLTCLAPNRLLEVSPKVEPWAFARVFLQKQLLLM